MLVVPSRLGAISGMHTRSQGVPPPPAGFVYLVDLDGFYLVDADGYFLLQAA